MRRYIFIIAIFFSSVFAHSTAPRQSVGLIVSGMTELFPHAYFYRGVGIEASYRYAFLQSSWCELQASGSLHYTATKFSATAFPTDDYPNGTEVGFTVGMIWNIALYKDYLRVYLGGFIGPMYTPKMPARQGGTINFSDNLCVGLQIKLYRALNLDLRYAYRHMSNCNFAKPNYGLNDHCVGIGFFYKF